MVDAKVEYHISKFFLKIYFSKNNIICLKKKSSEIFSRLESSVHTLISHYTVDFIMIFKNSKLNMYAKLPLNVVTTCSTYVTLRLSKKSI